MDLKGYHPLSDYAVIGDSGCAALVSRAGSIDWFCFPRFDSRPLFSALLDRERGGRFSVEPKDAWRAARRYLGNSTVLETTFVTERGEARLTDLVPVDDRDSDRLDPQRWLLRRVECTAGRMTLSVHFEPRPDFGRARAVLKDRKRLGLLCEFDDTALTLSSDIPLSISANGRSAAGEATLEQGQCCYLVLAGAAGEPAIIPAPGPHLDQAVGHTVRWWEAWVGQSSYNGAYREAVVRSVLTLKLLNYAPSGAVVAAATASLPERIGGERNWDYRYCWLRDASMIFRAFAELGFETESYAFLAWCLHTTRLSWPDLQVLYDVYGETHLKEIELSHVEGYAGSRPVRIGNRAQKQFQLDLFGEVVDAAYQYVLHGGVFDRATQRMVRGLGQAVSRRWREADNGIWEIRSDRRHHTHSKAMCWVALDCLIRMHDSGRLTVDRDRLVHDCHAIRDAIETHGYNERIQSYVSVFGGDTVDASLLLLPLYGYSPKGDARMAATHRRIKRDLGVNGLLYRFAGSFDGLTPGEGAFVVCSFWEAAYLAREGRMDEARAVFEHVLGLSNDVGLFAEEIDPGSGMALGNLPQGFSHVGLIHAAMEMEKNGYEGG